MKWCAQGMSDFYQKKHQLSTKYVRIKLDSIFAHFFVRVARVSSAVSISSLHYHSAQIGGLQKYNSLKERVFLCTWNDRMNDQMND